MFFFLSIVLTISLNALSHEIKLHPHMILRWEIMNPNAAISDKLIKFSLILRNGMRGWAGIGFRRDPKNFYWGMADADYIICYANTPDQEDPQLGCHDAYLYTNQQTGKDGQTNWDTVMPIPVLDTHPLVNGGNDIVFVKEESYRKDYGNDCITKWVFLRKMDTGDKNGDMNLAEKNVRGIWAFHDTNPRWETDPKKWNDNTRPAYHQGEYRGKFTINVYPRRSDDEL